MRRLVLEFAQKDIVEGSAVGGFVEKIESLEIIYHLKHDVEGFAGICRIKPKDPNLDLNDLSKASSVVKLELLSEMNGDHIVYLETRSRMTWFQGPNAPEVYLCPPIELREGKLKLTFLGSAGEIKRFLKQTENLGPRFKILSMTDARFAPDSVLQTLTDRQRRILSKAYSSGYYAVPRRINSEQLARRMNIVKSTLVEHLRKAEERVFSEILAEKEELFPLGRTT